MRPSHRHPSLAMASLQTPANTGAGSPRAQCTPTHTCTYAHMPTGTRHPHPTDGRCMLEGHTGTHTCCPWILTWLENWLPPRRRGKSKEDREVRERLLLGECECGGPSSDWPQRRPHWQNLSLQEVRIKGGESAELGIGLSGTIGLGGRCQDSLCGGPQHSQLCQGEEISCLSQELL